MSLADSGRGDPNASFDPTFDPPVGPADAAERGPGVEALLRQVIRIVEQGRPVPLSASVMVARDEVLALLRQALEAVPEELRAARWLLKERDDMRARLAREGEDIVAAARARAERMVQRSEVVKMAERWAKRTVGEAEDKSVRLKLDAEDWCDQRLAAFEAMLHKTLNAVSAGRQRLQDTGLPKPATSAAPTEHVERIFDQDVG